MPTLLELFKTKVLDSSGNTAEVDFDIKDFKKNNPISSSDPLLQQTGVRVVNAARKQFSNRLSETLLETELSGTRVYRAASEAVLYGTELVRISRRSTKILTDMKTATINEGGTVAPLISGALGRTRLGGAVNNFFANNPNGIVGGLLDRAERAGTQLLNRIGINLPTVMIPTRISLNDKFRRGSEPDTMITLSQIKEDSNGNIAGRVLSRVIDGTPRQIVRNAINEGLTAVRTGFRTALFGARKQGAQNLAKSNTLYFSYSSKDRYSDTVDEQIDDILLRNDLSTVAYGGDVEGTLFADYNKLIANKDGLQNQIIPLSLGGGSLGVESLENSANQLLNGGVAEEISLLDGQISSKKRNIDRVRKLSNNSRFRAQQNLAERIKDQKPNKYNDETQYSKTVDEENEDITLRNDLSELQAEKQEAFFRATAPGKPRSKESLDKLAEIGYAAPYGIGTDKANLYSEEFGTYAEGIEWWNTEDSQRSDLSTELLERRDRVSNDDYSDYTHINNFPGSIDFPTFPTKDNRNKYFNDGKLNSSYTKANVNEYGVQPIGGVGSSVRTEATFPGNIEMKLRGGLKASQLPYDTFESDFNKAIDKYSSLAISQGTYLSPNSNGRTAKLITGEALGINPGSDAINKLSNGTTSTADFVLLKFDSTQFRATITGLTETFSPSWDSGKFIGNAYNYYTYNGIERSVTFNFKIFSLNCDEHNKVWQRLEALSKKVYPKAFKGFGVTAPIIEFTMTDLYNGRKGFIESLTYTVDDNTPWHISDEVGKMTLPMIVDAAVTIKFIEYPGSESNLYDFEAELCQVVNKSANKQILDNAGSSNTTDNNSTTNTIRDSQGTTTGAGNSVTTEEITFESVDFDEGDDEGVDLIPQTPTSIQPRSLNNVQPTPQPTPTIQRQLPPSSNGPQPTTVPSRGLNPIDTEQPSGGIQRQSTISPLTKTEQSSSDIGTELQEDNSMIPPTTTTETGENIGGDSSAIDLSNEQEETLTTEEAYTNGGSSLTETTDGESKSSTLAKEQTKASAGDKPKNTQKQKGVKFRKEVDFSNPGLPTTRYYYGRKKLGQHGTIFPNMYGPKPPRNRRG